MSEEDSDAVVAMGVIRTVKVGQTAQIPKEFYPGAMVIWVDGFLHGNAVARGI